MSIRSGKNLSRTIPGSSNRRTRDGIILNNPSNIYGHTDDEARQRLEKAFADSSTDSLYRDPAGRGFLLRAGYLGKFGRVHPELINVLDSEVQHLAEIAQNPSMIFGEYEKEK